MGFRKAEVTAGGVVLGEVDPRTLESKLVPGLFLRASCSTWTVPLAATIFRRPSARAGWPGKVPEGV